MPVSMIATFWLRPRQKNGVLHAAGTPRYGTLVAFDRDIGLTMWTPTTPGNARSADTLLRAIRTLIPL